MRAIILALCCCFSLLAQQAGQRPAGRPVMAANPVDVPPPTIRPEDKCSIEGTVVNAVTGEPLKKAHLTLRPLGMQNGIPYGTTTDNAGHFLIDDVDPGRYSFSANRNGFVSQSYSPQGTANRNANLTLANAQKLKQVVFKLTPQGVISGRIVDEDGEPLANVMVQCMSYGYQRGRRQLMGQQGTSTNDLGEFRLHDLRPGKYVISATYRSPDMWNQVAERTVGSTQAVQAADEGYATTYYPNTTNAAIASQLDITPGAQISGINMTLARVRTVRIKGHISGMEAQTRRQANIMLVPRDNAGFGMPRAMARVMDGQGNFQMRGVVPGSYILRADYMQENQRFSARLPLEVGGSNIDGVELALQPTAELAGRVVIEDNGDLKGATLNVILRPRIMSPMMGGGGGPVKEDLTFKLANISPDPYDFNLNGLPEGFYLKSIRLGQQDVTDTGVDFSQGVSAEQLTVVINPNGGQIDGAAQNSKGDPAVGATVTLIPDESHQSVSWMYKVASTDQNGRFSIKGVRPGKYKLYSWEDMEPGAYQDPDYVKPHESAGESVEVKEGGHDTVQLKVVPAENSANQSAQR